MPKMFRQSLEFRVRFEPKCRRRSGGTYLYLLFRLTQDLSLGDAAYCSGAKRRDCTTCSNELSVAGCRPIWHGFVKWLLNVGFDILSSRSWAMVS